MPTYFLKTQFLLYVLTSFLLLNSGCKKNTTEPVETLALTVEDVSCTETWVKIASANIQIPNTLTLFVNEKVDQNITLVSSDTVLYIDSLLPNQSYKIKASFAATNQQQTTNEVIAKTMDTTTHNFTWQTFTFGEAGSSTLYDIAIINENDIWAVGEIYMNDSLGNTDPHAYNAVHWDGNKWEVKRIYYYGACSAVEYPPLKAIWAFSDSNIIVTNGGSIGWFDGKKVRLDCGVNPLLTGAINKIWGTSSSDLYAAGNGGNIAHYDGKNWQKIESGTTLNINDIWGDFNRRTQEWEILAVAADKFFNKGSSVLKMEKTRAKEINKTGLPWSLSSVWFHSSKNYFIGGDGLFSNKKINNDWGEVTDFPTFYKDRIRGVESNDIIVSGSNGLLSHFNGYSWHHYLNNELPYFTGRLLSVEVKNNIIVATGWKEQGSIIILGRR